VFNLLKCNACLNKIHIIYIGLKSGTVQNYDLNASTVERVLKGAGEKEKKKLRIAL
jgi:hypothetical protein